MTRNLIVIISLVTFGMSTAYTQVADVEQTRADFEKLATEMPYLCLASVIFDRPDHYFKAADPNISEKHFRILDKVTDRNYAVATLVDLLAHGDAKVRTLAAVALFDREDPTVLPSLVKLCEDKSVTFDGHPELAREELYIEGVGPLLEGSGPPAKDQTVGGIIKSMVSFYMTEAGFYYGITPKNKPGFAEYWESRKNRVHCAGWFAVRLARASRGIRSTQEDCIPRIRLLREDIDKLSTDERAWVLLWLNGEAGSDALVTEEELTQACMTLGRDKLLLMLQRKIPSDDPDLQSRTSWSWPSKRMKIFVLSQAKQLLYRGDGYTLLECEQWERDFQKHGISDPTITPWWAIAAASLEPEKASQTLRAAMNRFHRKLDSRERATLCIAMWQLCGKAEMKFIVDWFFNEQPEHGSFPTSRGQFIEAMRGQTNGREIIAEIIKDNRLNDLDWQSLKYLVRAVNSWIKTPIVSEEEIHHKVWHPLGEGHYHWEKDNAKMTYPKETEELEKHLRDWQTRLQKSVHELLNENIDRKNVE